MKPVLKKEIHAKKKKHTHDFLLYLSTLSGKSLSLIDLQDKMRFWKKHENANICQPTSAKL